MTNVAKKPSRVIDDIGGEEAIRDLVERFYDIVEATPEGKNIELLHGRGHGLSHARIEQFNFLCGFFGGRQYYKEKHGHADVKLMHAHVPITTEDAENWLTCMDRTLEELGHSGENVEKLRATFRRVALALVNEPDPT